MIAPTFRERLSLSDRHSSPMSRPVAMNNLQSFLHRLSRLGPHHRSCAIGAAMICLLALPACEDRTPPAPPPTPPDVRVARPITREVTDYLFYSGNTAANAVVTLRARVPGYLQEMNFIEGTEVKAGDVLFVIERDTYEANVARAQANLEARRAALAGAEADAELAAELAAQRAGPDIDRVISAARRDAAKAEVGVAESQLRLAEIDLGYAEVVAPMDGRIGERRVDIGNLVGTAGSTELATIVAIDPIYVTVNVSESDVLRIRRAQLGRLTQEGHSGRMAAEQLPELPVFMALADDTGFPFEGRVDFVDPQVDQRTGTINVRLRFDNPDAFILPGFFVRLRFPLVTNEQIVVPKTALSQDQAGFFLLAVDMSGTVSQRRVTVGAEDGDDRVVLSGVTTDDVIIVSGLQRARVGSKVNPVPVDGVHRTPSLTEVGPASRR